jgi:glycerol-3-phosphate acyltransferase PlsX
MGGENSPETLQKMLSLLPLDEDVELVLIGPSSLATKAADHPHISLHTAETFVSLEDNPITALKKKKNASMFVGLSLLKEGKIDALVSSGNTGALLVGAKRILSTFPKIGRPALLGVFPTKKEPMAVLDLGASVQCKATHLVQFALLAAAYIYATRGIKHPKIGFLNIGEEPLKGTSELRLAYSKLQSLSSPSFQFVGNVEGHSIFNGDVDALITDGFTGNTFLKVGEATASFILDRIHTHWPIHVVQSIEKELKDLQTYLHYSEYRGALLIGVQGIVIKCHSYSTSSGVAKAVQGAIDLVKKKFMKTIQTCTF